MEDDTADIAAVTCGLLDNMVTVCGEVWRQCHDLAQVMVTRDTRDTCDTCDVLQVERMRGMFVESLVARNRGATVDIEQCESISKFRCSFII